LKRVIAAIDNSLAAQPVLATAGALAQLLGAELAALHVIDNGDAVARSAAAGSGIELRTAPGPTVERLIEAGSDEDVVAMVLGARGRLGAARPVGMTALEVATSLPKPLVVVPPDVSRPGVLHRILVPLEGTMSTSLAPQMIFEPARGAELEVVILHVHDEASIPAFTDQPQHETAAWTEEFLARYVPSGVGDVRVETRVGRRDEQILHMARQTDADLIALGWSQELAPGRAPVVRAALERGHVPVLLVPVSSGNPEDSAPGVLLGV